MVKNVFASLICGFSILTGSLNIYACPSVIIKNVNSATETNYMITVDNINDLLYPYTWLCSTANYNYNELNQDDVMIQTAFSVLVNGPESYYIVSKDKIDDIAEGYFGKKISNHHSVGLFIYNPAREEYEIIPTGGFGYGEVTAIKETTKIDDSTYKCIVSIYRTVGYDMDGNPPDIYDAEITVRISPSATYGMYLLSYRRVTSNSYYVCENQIPIYINGREIVFAEEPYIKNSTTMVPMRGIFEELGASVEYDAVTKTITAYKGSTVIELVTGSSRGKINGRDVYLSVPVENKNGTTMVPARFVSEALGAQVLWDSVNKTISINQ